MMKSESNQSLEYDMVRRASHQNGYIAGVLLTKYILELEKSNHDELTGLLNRHGLNDELKDKDLSDYSLIYCDVNNFKKINDLFGHNKGDYFLQQLADKLKKSYRPEDLIARLGGDEFVLLINHKQRSLETISLEEKTNIIKDRFSQLVTSIIGSQPKKYHEQNLGIAFGVVSYQENDSLFSMINRADQLMYHAKDKSKDF